MGELTQYLDQMSDEKLDSLVREQELGQLNFGEQVALLRVIRKVGLAYDREPVDEVSDSSLSEAHRQFPQILDQMNQMASVNLTQGNAHSAREQIQGQLSAHCDWILSNLKPQIRAENVELGGLVEEARSLIATAQMASRETDAMLAKVRALAGEVGAGKLSTYYQTQANGHRATARWYLIGAAASAAVLVVLAIILLPSISVPQDTPDNRVWLDFTRQLVVRLFLLGVVSYAVAFCVRAYRANTHLRVANEQKRNALDTYGLFVESVSTDEARDVVTAALVQAVFTQTETGFLDKAAEKTIFESQGDILGALSRSRSTSA